MDKTKPVLYYRCDGCNKIVSRKQIWKRFGCKCGCRRMKDTRVTMFDKLVVKLFNR